MKSVLFTGEFWLNTTTRLVKTFAQAFVALLVGEQASLLTIDWTNSLAVAGLAALVSVFTSIASADNIVAAPATAEGPELHAAYPDTYNSHVVGVTDETVEGVLPQGVNDNPQN